MKHEAFSCRRIRLSWRIIKWLRENSRVTASCLGSTRNDAIEVKASTASKIALGEVGSEKAALYLHTGKSVRFENQPSDTGTSIVTVAINRWLLELSRLRLSPPRTHQ